MDSIDHCQHVLCCIQCRWAGMVVADVLFVGRDYTPFVAVAVVSGEAQAVAVAVAEVVVSLGALLSPPLLAT